MNVKFKITFTAFVTLVASLMFLSGYQVSKGVVSSNEHTYNELTKGINELRDEKTELNQELESLDILIQQQNNVFRNNEERISEIYNLFDDIGKLKKEKEELEEELE